MKSEDDFGVKQPCPCAQEAVDTLKAIQPIKESMLKKVKCKGCGKHS
ncbi:MAG: hypothetical protein NZ932_00540 [Candidatus Bathyarchaeota archaeon]|nr:hypothetical protein [Candidatus Bathyarchaeota archaeon]MDW8040959.1 hypothetical protein [Nitrososphaerota archaeon]